MPRRRYNDTRTVGRSALCPFVPGEDAASRHLRRLSTNVNLLDEVTKECKELGVGLAVTNGGHHWRFTKGPHIVEWWPSSAKMVFGKRWRRGLHVHDVRQAIAQVRRFFTGGLR